MSRTLIFPLLLLIGVFALLPSNALADANYSACDYTFDATTLGGPWSGQSYGCNSGIDVNRTLYGAEIYVNSNSGGYFGAVVNGTWVGGGAAAALPGGTGYMTVYFDTPISVSAGETVLVGVSGDENTFSGNSTTVKGYPYTSPNNIYRVFEWSPDIVPPTTEFNEVIDYIYDPVLDNSFGTSTVGATFSIAEPDWLTSFGFDLRGPMGNILYTGSSTTAVPATIDVSVDYYFDSSGAYELVAWFIDDAGVKNVNPVTVFITVNVPAWVFDPVTGDLVPEASTTIATSTLTNFNIECPDDLLVGSLCKFAVGFFVPSPASIQGLQASFYGLMNKAPFSFFTQSKTLLEAFRTGTAATGGSLTLSLYGSSIPIISSTTADNVGVDSSTIDLLKGVMIVGLWLMLAWYLYWRIASIFGV